MSQRRFAALLLAAVATLGACGPSDASDGETAAASPAGNVVAVGGAPLPGGGDGGGSLGDAMDVAAEAPGQAADAACVVDRQTLQAAVEAYELLDGSLPTSEQQLLDAQLIREPSGRFEVSADGAVVPAPGSPCR